MTAGLEVSAAEEWLFGVLNGDATLVALLAGGIKPGGSAPQGTPFPFLTYQLMSAIDEAVVGAFRIWTDMIFLVKVVAHSADELVMNAALARIDTLLHRASGTATDGIVWTCTRETAIRITEVVSGDQYRHAGATWRIQAT